MGRLRPASALAIMVLCLGACGQATSSSVPSSPVPASADGSGPPAASPVASAISLAGSPLLGTYATTIPEGEDNAPPGDWLLTVTADRVQFTHPDGHTFSPGTVVAASADEITFASDPGCPGQTELTPGRYGWTIAGDALTFTELDPDTCRDRAGTLTTSPWTRTSP